MITVNDVNQLISQWTQRISDPTYSQSYRDTLFECCYELNSLVKHSIEEEMTYQDALKQIDYESERA